MGRPAVAVSAPVAPASPPKLGWRFRRRQAFQYWAPVMVNVMGILTFETDPGLNRHCRKALSAALSNTGFPILDAIEALVTLPLPASTSTTHTPVPVICRERA